MPVVKDFTGYMLVQTGERYKDAAKLLSALFIPNVYPTFNEALATALGQLTDDLNQGLNYPMRDKIYKIYASELDFNRNYSGWLNQRAYITIDDLAWHYTPELYTRPALPAVAAVRAKHLAEKQRVNRLLNASLRYHDKTI